MRWRSRLAEGWVLESQPRQTQVVKTGSDSSTATRSAIGVSVTGPGRCTLKTDASNSMIWTNQFQLSLEDNSLIRLSCFADNFLPDAECSVIIKNII